MLPRHGSGITRGGMMGGAEKTALGGGLSFLQNGWSALRQRVDRRHVLILVSGALICLYALGVLGYVLTIPDIGLHCPFSREIARVSDGYAPEGSIDGPREGDWLTRVGDQRAGNWQQLLRAISALETDSGAVLDAGQEESASWADVERVAATRELKSFRFDGATWVEAEFVRPPDDTAAEAWRRNGYPPEDAPRLTAWRRVGQPRVDSVLPAVLWFFLKLGLFLIGALVFWQRPDDPYAPQLFLLCVVTIGAFMGGYHWLQIITQPALLLVFMTCSVLLPAASLHFYLLFPRPKSFMNARRRLALAVIYGPPLVFLVALLSGYLVVRRLYDPEHVAPVTGVLIPALQAAVFVYIAVAALWYLGCVVSLVHSYRTTSDATERNQVKWILLGAVTALVPIGYSLYLALWETDAFGKGAATWPMFAASVCFTAAFAVSITRYRLMQLDQLISSGVSYFLISFLAGLLYYGVVFFGMTLVGSQVMPGPSLGQALSVSSTALILLLVLDLARTRLKRALDRHFRREKHQLDRTLKRMSQAIEQLVDPSALARRLLQTSAELLGVSQGAVYVRQGDPPLFVLAGALGPPPPLTELSSGCPLVEAVQVHGTLLAESPRHAAADPVQRQLRFLGAFLAQPLVHEGQMRALLVLGAKDNGAYVVEDLNLLAAFAQITVLALVSAEGHRTIEGLNGELQEKVEKIAEQQRRILALQTQLTLREKVREERESDSSDQEKEENAAGASSATSPLATGPGGIVGRSPQIRHLLHQVRKIAASQSEVLIRGESGTGKELLARALHETSPRAGKPYVKVHCAALSPGLLESELFGHVRGAFTGAHRDKVGRFELANGGTLFLDEIGDIDLSVQTKLLRVLQEMTFERVGSSETIQVDVRVIAATHQDLETLIRQGRFREDLYYRINVISITVPALRERCEDIPELVHHFLRIYGASCGRPDLQIDDDALVVLKSYHWPGNIRQLENVVERAVVFAEGPTVTVRDLPPDIFGAGRDPFEHRLDSPEILAPLLTSGLLPAQAERADRARREREQLVRALAAAQGNKAEAARSLGLARSTLISRLKKHGLS
jgi:transcriptional regulator with GAF, ATPase, and Fis domain